MYHMYACLLGAWETLPTSDIRSSVESSTVSKRHQHAYYDMFHQVQYYTNRRRHIIIQVDTCELLVGVAVVTISAQVCNNK